MIFQSIKQSDSVKFQYFVWLSKHKSFV